MNFTPKVLLAQLIKNGVINQQQADHFELESLQKNLSIFEYLLKHTELKKTDTLNAAAELLNIASVDLAALPIDPEAVSLISESIARRYRILPYKFDHDADVLYIASTEPFNTYMTEFISRKVSKRIVLALADGEDIDRSLDIAYAEGGLTPDVRDALKEYAPVVTDKLSESKISASIIKEAPVAKIVSTILEFAAKSRASDVHIEPEITKTRVRYRIDGFLNEKLSLPLSLHDALISRIKILSQMKIDERRIPQDGRFSFKLGLEEIDLRVSTLPTVHGEKVVMRLLKKTGGIPTLTELGVRGPMLKDLELAITKPYGIILVTGPTGSGKTTTLYSMLSRLNKPTVNILTLEDPVEYELPGINQVQINPQAGLTFASGLRSLLRQDPNIILVGEVRDTETTQLAIQAALTGHLVFSTLHTNDSATAIPRLIDLGAEPFLISSVLNGVLAQRIVRKICEACREKYIPDVAVLANIRDVLGDLMPQQYVQGAPVELYRGRGCDECAGTGYLGRLGIFELTPISTAINKMIIKQVTARDIETQARQEGMILMKQDGYLKALDGLTTIEETLRVSESE